MSEIFRVGWNWHPSVVIGFTIWTFLYTRAIEKGRPILLKQQLAFHFGTLVGLVALVSPLDELGDGYLFSAHMIQHLLLMFVTAPLWLIGAPGWMLDAIIPNGLMVFVKWISSPMSACATFVGVMWLWHVPAVYGMAQQNEGIHIFEHLTFIGAALIGWWPVAGAETSIIPKPQFPLRMLYLFLLGVPCTALAVILTFAHTPLYSFYVTVVHPFGLNALQDQHLGGLLMWVPTHMILFLAFGITFLKWFADSDRQAEQSFVESVS